MRWITELKVGWENVIALIRQLNENVELQHFVRGCLSLFSTFLTSKSRGEKFFWHLVRFCLSDMKDGFCPLVWQRKVTQCIFESNLKKLKSKLPFVYLQVFFNT